MYSSCEHRSCPVVQICIEYLKRDYVQKTFGIRNYIERWQRTFKQRTKRFYNNFPVKDPSRAIVRIGRNLFLKAQGLEEKLTTIAQSETLNFRNYL